MSFKSGVDIRHIAHKQLHGREGSFRESKRTPKYSHTPKSILPFWLVFERQKQEEKERKKKRKFILPRLFC